MKFDIYLVGVGGQGILTIGEILAETALNRGVPVSFYPSKGMAQGGGFVKAQLRLGQAEPGANISERSADVVIAMEVSEALKAVRFVRPGGDFVLLGDVWLPVPVLIRSKGASYPELATVTEQVRLGNARMIYINPASLPVLNGVTAPANVYILGALLKQTRLGELFAPADILQVIETRWKKAVEINRFAFQSGWDLQPAPAEAAV